MHCDHAETLGSFGDELNVVVVGASGGIGEALIRHLSADPAVAAIAACRRRGDVLDHRKVMPLHLDLLDEGTIERAAKDIGERMSPVHLVIVATGILHDDAGLSPEKTWRTLDPSAMEKVFRINTIGPAMVGKHFLPLLARDRKSVFAAISARVGSIGDNQLGGWHAYRASKAALNMILKNFAIELARRNPKACCIGLHPGTVATNLSSPFQGGVAKGKLFTAMHAAGCLLQVIDDVTNDESGSVFAWDGQIIPP
ncbi:MAG: SDR family NAD(P)-dependent oxidoreductase [Pseudomonadota bacterium]